MELREFLFRLGGVYLIMFVIAIFLAYFISKYITRSLATISDKLHQTDLTKRNEKIFVKNPSEEIGKLIDSYNEMIDELEQSAAKLARSEREQASAGNGKTSCARNKESVNTNATHRTESW